MCPQISDIPKGHLPFLAQTASCEPLYVFFRRSVQPAREREKKIQKNIKRIKVWVIYFSYAWRRAYSSSCDESLHICWNHQHNDARQFWCSYVKVFAFCEGPIFPQEVAVACNIVLRYRTGKWHILPFLQAFQFSLFLCISFSSVINK